MCSSDLSTTCNVQAQAIAAVLTDIGQVSLAVLLAINPQHQKGIGGQPDSPAITANSKALA